MNPVLVLPPHHGVDDQIIWREGVRRGYKIIRARSPKYDLTNLPAGTSVVYYGDVLHARKIHGLGVTAPNLDPRWISRVADPANAFGRSIAPLRAELLFNSVAIRDAFIKCTHEKWFKPRVVREGRQFMPDTTGIDPEDILHVSDVVQFSDEVRCFVLDGQIATWSRYSLHGTFTPDRPDYPPEVHAVWQSLVNLVAPALPSGVVIDLGLLVPQNQWVVVEANEAWASGIYECDAARAFDVIVRSNELPHDLPDKPGLQRVSAL